MSRYQSDDEQIDAIKSWWKKNGTSLLTGILIVVATASGWRYWQNSQFVEKANASATFEMLQVSEAQGSFGDVAREALKLMNESPKSPYASAAALLHAKYSLQKGDQEEATANLQWVVDHAPDVELKAVAQMRMTRLLSQQGQFDDALQMLETIKVPTNALAMVAERSYLKGLIMLSKANLDEARMAFQAVVDNPETDENLRGLAGIQLADLAQ